MYEGNQLAKGKKSIKFISSSLSLTHIATLVDDKPWMSLSLILFQHQYKVDQASICTLDLPIEECLKPIKVHLAMILTFKKIELTELVRELTEIELDIKYMIVYLLV